MHLGLGDGSRLEALFHAVFYLTGVPILFSDYNGNSNHSVGIIGGSTIDNNTSLETGLSEATTIPCYESLGCFNIRYGAEKGYNVTPNSLDDVAPTICLYTKPQIHTCQVVEAETILGSSLTFSNGSGSFWIAHGYIENGQRPWINAMVKELLDYDSFANVFVIDWSEASKPPYNQAVENVEMIAAYCANIMVKLQDAYNLQINETHFIGHSLGSHFAGYVGSWLQENKNLQLKRISGLDPAQLYFQGYPIDARLDPSDALFVDVIHTDAKPFLNGGETGSDSHSNSGKANPSRPVSGLGTQEASGHADFYPNSGKDQPGCKDGVYQAILQEEGSVINGIRRYLGCDHIRSHEYFTESIRSPCPYMAFACESWQDFMDSSCAIGSYNRMGFHATKPAAGNDFAVSANSSTIYYSITGPRPPFCREHYKVILELAEESKYRSTAELHLVLGENGAVNGASTKVLNLGPIDFTGSNLTRKYTVSGFNNNGFPKRITLRPSSSNPVRWLMNKGSTSTTPLEPDVVVANVTLVHLERDQYSTVFCPDPDDKNFFSVKEPNPAIIFSSESCKTN